MRQIKPVRTSRRSAVRAAAVLPCAIGALLFVSCGRTHSGATVGATHASPAGEACLAPTIPLADVLRDIDAYPIPKAVSAQTWAALTGEMKRLLIARAAGGKTISIAASGALNAVTDLSATFDATGTKTTTTWTEVLPGDYNNDGSVDVGDLGPVALYYGQFTNTGSNDGHRLVVGDTDPEINIADLQMIAENYSAHVQGYRVLRGLFNGTGTDWEATPRPNPNPANPNWSADRPSSPPVNARPTYTYTDDLTGIADTSTVRYRVVPCGDGGSGWASNVAAVPTPPTFSISGTVTAAAGSGIAEVAMTLAPGGLSTTTQADGTYTIPDVPNGSYTLTPSAFGCTFAPASQPVVVAGADAQGNDFTGTILPAAWPQFGHDQFNTNRSDSVVVQPGRVKWTSPSVAGVSWPPLLGLRGIVYCIDGKGDLCAINPADGSLRWSTQVGNTNSSPVLGPDGTIYVERLGGNLYAVNLTDGSVKWQCALGSQTDGALVCGPDGTVYAMTFGGNLFAVSPDGATKWSCSLGGAPNVLKGSAIGADGTVYAPGGGRVETEGSVFAVDPSDGSVKWSRTDLGTGTGSFSECGAPAVGPDGTVYVPTLTFVGQGIDAQNVVTLYALDPADGATRWSYTPATYNGGFFCAPAIGADGTVFLTYQDYAGIEFGTAALNPSDGSVVWTNASYGGYGPPAIGADGTLYAVGGQQSTLYALSPADGSVEWSYSSTGYTLFLSTHPVIGLDGTIYLRGSSTSTQGTVLAFGP